MNKPCQLLQIIPKRFNGAQLIYKFTCPKEPVATSTNGNFVVGWPSMSLVNFLRVRRSALSKNPARAHAASNYT